MTIGITLIIPCFNSGPYISETISSIDNQIGDFNIDEIIIVDDASDDATKNLLEELNQGNNLVRVVQNSGAKGAAGARNTGLHMACSEWVIFLDADDVLTENSIQVRVEALKKYPRCGWISGDFSLWNGLHNEEPVNFFQSHKKTYDVLEKSFLSKQEIRISNPVPEFISVCITAVGVGLIKKSLVIELGGFREHLKQAEDYQFWIRLARISDFVFVPEVLMLYRQHDASTTAQDLPPRFWTIKAFEELLNDLSFLSYRVLINERLAEFHIENSFYFRKKKCRARAIKCLLKSFLQKPSVKPCRFILSAILKG